MNVYILGDCVNIQIADNGGRYFINAPEDIMAIGGGYTIVSEIMQDDGSFIGEFKLRDDILFPYEGRNIRVEMNNSQIRNMLKSPYKALIDYGLTVPNQDTDDGVVMWFAYLYNDSMTEQQVKTVLESFGAVITIK